MRMGRPAINLFKAIGRKIFHAPQSTLMSLGANKPSLEVCPSSLDMFVSRIDELGGPANPGAQAYWSGFRYNSNVSIDQDLDPYSNQYVEQQISLYQEISGRTVNQVENELTTFNLPEHVAAINPYAHLPPTTMGLHMARIAKALEYSGLGLDDHIVDMGCGWGMSCELLAYSGLKVTALDINPDFVELVRQRTGRTGYRIKAVRGSFEQIPTAETYDAAIFYESLHHAVKPWEALATVAGRLRQGGKLLLAGEPVNDMWRSWGIRTDALSIYCIRKHGWFESGWSSTFLRDCIQKCGFTISRCSDEGGSIGWIIVAEKN